MGNKIYCENFNLYLKNLKNETKTNSNNTKIIFWKINTNFFNFFNKNSQEISEINLFDYFNETKNDDNNIYLIGILTKKKNFIDLNKIFNIDLANKHLMFIKHMNDDLNQIRISFFFLCYQFEKTNFFNINNKYIKYIESIKNVPNFFMLLYSNANEEIDIKTLENFNLNSKNIIVKILAQIILEYINNNNNDNNNNDNNNKIPDIPISSILNKKTFNLNTISITSNNNFTLLSSKSINTNNTNIFNNKIINHININNNNQKIKDLIEEDLTQQNYIEEEEEEFEEKNNFIPLPSSRGNKQERNRNIYEEEEEEDFYPPESSFRMNNNNDYSEIIENFLYLGNYKIANDISRLNKIGIEYIINLCQDICNNINDKKIKFLSFNMKDSTKENIECIFYMCFDFINKCKSENKKILIHCYQGISRSACLVTAYLIFTKKIDSDKAFNYVQKKRKIANPNLGFFFQLNIFYNRITMQKNHLNVYAISSFQIEQPNLIVCRLIYHNMILNPENVNNIKPLPIFDERGIFIIGDFNNVVILIGNKIYNSCKEVYLNTAKNYYEKYLNVYENINIKKNDVVIVNQNEKNNKILNDLLNEHKVNINFGLNKKLDNFYIDLNNIENNNNNNNKIEDENENIKKLFYFYPNKEGFKVLNLEDLSENELLFACYENKTNKIIFIWKGKNVNINKEEFDNYKNLIKPNFFNDCSNIIEKIENPLEETEEFLNLI